MCRPIAHPSPTDVSGNAKMDAILDMICGFLTSKSLIDAEVALRRNVQHLFQHGDDQISTFNHFTSDLERELDMIVGGHPTAVRTLGDTALGDTALGGTALGDTALGGTAALDANEDMGESLHSTLDVPVSRPEDGSFHQPNRQPLVLFERLQLAEAAASEYRERRGTGSVLDAVVFHDQVRMSPQQQQELTTINLPVLINPNSNGLEEEREFVLPSGSFIAGRYRVIKASSSGSFSTFYSCVDHGAAADATGRLPTTGTGYRLPKVGLKVLKNSKDSFDAGLGEVAILSRIQRCDPSFQRAPPPTHHRLPPISSP